jgi:hypothetical protein
MRYLRGPFTAHGNRMVARVRCARHARNARRVRARVRARIQAQSRNGELVSRDFGTCERP